MDQIKEFFDGIVEKITAAFESLKKTIEDLLAKLQGYIPEIPDGKED